MNLSFTFSNNMNNKFLTYLCLLYSRHWQALSSTEKSEGQKWEINAALSMPYFFKSLRQRSISVTACNYVIMKQFKLSYFIGIDSQYVFMTRVIFVRSIALLTAVKILKVLHLHCRQWVERGFSLKKIWSILESSLQIFLPYISTGSIGERGQLIWFYWVLQDQN